VKAVYSVNPFALSQENFVLVVLSKAAARNPLLFVFGLLDLDVFLDKLELAREQLDKPFDWVFLIELLPCSQLVDGNFSV